MDKPTVIHTGDAVQPTAGHPTESGTILYSDTDLGKVGDTSANHAWAHMSRGGSGGGVGHMGSLGADAGHPGSTGSSDNATASASVDLHFGHHGDIYNGAGGEVSAGGEGGGAQSSSSAGYFMDSPQGANALDQATLERGLTPSSTAALYGDIHTGSGHGAGSGTGADGGGYGQIASSGGGMEITSARAAGGTDAGLDRRVSSGVADNNRPPELSMPTPEQIRSAPVAQLQAMSKDTRQALDGYVRSQGDSLPPLAFHGTSASSGSVLANLPQRGGEIWVAGQNPDRQALGAHQRVGDLSASLQTSINYADDRGTGGNTPGPVLVYDAGNQPQAWSKTSFNRQGSQFDGFGNDDNAKFGKLDLGQAKLLGSISRENIDGLKQQFAPHHEALQAKQTEIMLDPAGMDPAKVSDLHARAKALAEINRAHEVRMALDLVAQAIATQQ
jgi:hypothetical protein